MSQVRPWDRKEYIRADGQAFCWRCRQWHPARVGERLDCPIYGTELARIVVRRTKPKRTWKRF